MTLTPATLGSVPTGHITKRQQEALDYRIAGKSYRQIAAEMKISPITAHELVTKALQHQRERTGDKIEEVLELELTRLDEMMQVCVGILSKKTVQVVTKEGVVLEVDMDDDVKMRALDRLVKIQERRSKLLGMERTKVDATVDGPWANFLADVITGTEDAANEGPAGDPSIPAIGSGEA